MIQSDADVHVEMQYSSEVIGSPPFEPRVNAISIARSREIALVTTGASGADFGVVHKSDDARPVPTAFNART